LLLRKYLFSKIFWINLIPIVAALLVIIGDYYFIYDKPENVDNNSVAVGLFDLYNNTNTELTWFYILIIFTSTIIYSFLFPIVLLLKNKVLLKEQMIQFAILCTFFGLIISNTFYETGGRAMHGNFLWQNYMCSFLLFFVCA